MRNVPSGSGGTGPLGRLELEQLGGLRLEVLKCHQHGEKGYK